MFKVGTVLPVDIFAVDVDQPGPFSTVEYMVNIQY